MSLLFWLAVIFGGLLVYLLIGRVYTAFEVDYPDADGYDHLFWTIGWLPMLVGTWLFCHDEF